MYEYITQINKKPSKSKIERNTKLSPNDEFLSSSATVHCQSSCLFNFPKPYSSSPNCLLMAFFTKYNISHCTLSSPFFLFYYKPRSLKNRTRFELFISFGIKWIYENYDLEWAWSKGQWLIFLRNCGKTKQDSLSTADTVTFQMHSRTSNAKWTLCASFFYLKVITCNPVPRKTAVVLTAPCISLHKCIRCSNQIPQTKCETFIKPSLM